MVFDWDDFGCNHILSDMCQSHDCRDMLDRLHEVNPAFKCTLFAIPGEMTPEVQEWCFANRSWVELAYHGFFHTSNYECEKMSYDEFDKWMEYFGNRKFDSFFVHGFKAPGWQISDGVYEWLSDHDWWIADQAYNTERRHKISVTMSAYVNDNGKFFPEKYAKSQEHVDAWHGHTWDCCGNGIYETFDQVKALVKNTKEFKFVSEVLA